MSIVTGADIASALGLPTATPSLDAAAEVATALIEPYLAPGSLDSGTPAPIREAGVVLAIDVYQNRTAAGGQSVSIDGSGYGPYRMGKSLLDRVTGLLGPWLDSGSEIR